MASITLYPPLVDATAPAFVASGDSAYCRLYFSLSKYSSSTSQIKSIHISVVKQTSGQSVVKKSDSKGRYRATGIIILNTTPIKVEDTNNLYYIDILNDDIKSGDRDGWYPGWIYKLQLRLSTVEYPGNIGQTAWLNANSNNFSEWSTYCTTKAISQPVITVPIMKGFNSEIDGNISNKDKQYSLSLSTLDFAGEYFNTDVSETLYSYTVQLYSGGDNVELIEDSGTIYTSQYYTPNQFHYLLRTELDNSKEYIVRLTYVTINKYTETYDFNIIINLSYIEETTISAVTIDTLSNLDNQDFVDNFNSQTSITTEQEEGRIGIKLYSSNTNPYNGNICLRRTDSKSNFQIWTDIKITTCINTIINELPLIFDYTAESGVWYKYGVETISVNGERGIMNAMTKQIIREWDYAYLLGEGGRQLKLPYDNQMGNYTYTVLEAKTDTIGGKYPIITRNGNTNYRTFPINGLITFNMDENNVFTSDKEIYKYSDIINAYKNRRQTEHLGYYDYKREFDFREKVLEFLKDGKPKLFKSATEGNIIVTLMSVNTQPNQSLDRMIYSFTSTAVEVAESTMENYQKYGFFNIGTWSSSFEFYNVKIGQVDFTFNVGDNIIAKIWELFDRSNQNIAGIRKTLKVVHHLSLQFDDKPFKIINSGNQEMMGNNFSYGGNLFTVPDYGGIRYYVFDENIKFTKGSNITVLGDEDGYYNTVHVLVDFLYESIEEPYIEKEVETRTSVKGIGQIFDSVSSGDDIYRDIYYRYYYEWPLEFRRLNRVTWTCIEANPGAVFLIQDETDVSTSNPQTMYHEIGWTGLLNLEELGTIKDIKYIGMRKPDGSIDRTIDVDVILDYIYYATEGTYKEEE